MLKCTSLVHTVSSPLLKIKFIQNGSSLRLKPSGITYKYNLMHHCDHMFFILIEQESSDYSSFRLEIVRHQQQVIHFSSKSKPSSINLITHIHFSSNSNHAPHTQITTYRNYGVPKKCCYFFSSCYLNYVKILINIP